MMTNERLAELEALAEKAFVGPWEPDFHGQWVMGAGNQFRVCDIRGWGYLTGSGGLGLSDKEAAKIQDATTAFIAASRTAIPELIAALRAERDEHDATKECYAETLRSWKIDTDERQASQQRLTHALVEAEARVKALQAAGRKFKTMLQEWHDEPTNTTSFAAFAEWDSIQNEVENEKPSGSK